MTKHEFFMTLEEKLRMLSSTERKKILAFYDEAIGDRMENGMSEENAVADVGNVEDIAREILADQPLPVLIHEKVRDFGEKGKSNILWIILAVIGFPIWLPILLSGAAVLFSVYISIWSVVISLYAVLLSLGFSGAAMLFYGFIRMFSAGFVEGVAILGVGLVCLGLFLAVLKPILWLTKQCALLAVNFVRWMKRKLSKKKEGI